jgi:hypothetical protein
MTSAKKSKSSVSIGSAKDVVSLMTYKGLLEARHGGEIKLRIPALSLKDTQSFENSLNKYREECGCSSGKISLFAALGLAVIYLVLRHDISVKGIITGVTILGASGAAGAIIGKIAGLAVANVKFRQTCAEILARTNPA